MNVTIPERALAGVYTLDISAEGSSESQTISVDVEVLPWANGSLNADKTEFNSTPGGSVDIVFDLENLGNTEDEFSLSFSGIPNTWTVSYSSGSSVGQRSCTHCYTGFYLHTCNRVYFAHTRD